MRKHKISKGARQIALLELYAQERFGGKWDIKRLTKLLHGGLKWVGIIAQKRTQILSS